MNRMWSLLLCSALALAGCSSSKDGPDRLANAEAFCNTLLDAYATKDASCWARTAAASREELEFFLPCAVVGDAEAAGRLAYDRAQAAACLSELAATTCWTWDHTEELISDACLQAFGGSAAPEERCTLVMHDLECTPGSYCEVDSCDLELPGRCLEYAQEGEDCGESANYRVCAGGLSCDYFNTDKCVAQVSVGFAGEGESCSGRGCQEGLYCEDAETTCAPQIAIGQECTESDACERGASCEDGFCVAWRRVGAACTPGNEQCVDGAYCDAATERCTAWPRAGGACGTPGGGEYRGCIDSWCRVEPVEILGLQPLFSSESGICTPYVEEGAACESGQTWSQCGPLATCDGTCERNYCANLL
ncbi:MAG TPA: hypothetical protein VEB43_17325 [Anaeromyxobacter sp.]|nr:hypothetical protein [Anaeromyxobacter sp.]